MHGPDSQPRSTADTGVDLPEQHSQLSTAFRARVLHRAWRRYSDGHGGAGLPIDGTMHPAPRSCPQTSVREEDEDTLVDGNRKRALSESVTGGAAALLKVGFNLFNCPYQYDCVYREWQRKRKRETCIMWCACCFLLPRYETRAPARPAVREPTVTARVAAARFDFHTHRRF